MSIQYMRVIINIITLGANTNKITAVSLVSFIWCQKYATKTVKMDNLKPPRALSFEGNCSANFKRWLQALEIYYVASGINEKSDSVKIANLLHVGLGGERVIDIITRLNGQM